MGEISLSKTALKVMHSIWLASSLDGHSGWQNADPDTVLSLLQTNHGLSKADAKAAMRVAESEGVFTVSRAKAPSGKRIGNA